MQSKNKIKEYILIHVSKIILLKIQFSCRDLNLSNVNEKNKNDEKCEEDEKDEIRLIKIKNNTDLPIPLKCPEIKSLSSTCISSFFSEKIEIIKYTLKLIQQEGILSLYDGMTSSILGSVVQYAVYFCASKFCSYSFDHMEIKISGIGRSMLINLLAATCTALVTNPIWVVNARMAKKRSKEVKFFKFFKFQFFFPYHIGTSHRKYRND